MTTRLGALVVAVLLAACTAMIPASPRPSITAGHEAPGLDVPGVVVSAAGDEATSLSVTLIFSKPDDAHTQHAINAIKELHANHPNLAVGSRTVLVLSRLGVQTTIAEAKVPTTWRVLHDTKDTLYAEYGVIATPTVVVVDATNHIVGVHPGYNADLAGAVWHDLRVAIDGADSLNAPTPTPGIMDVQMGRQLARRKLWDRALVYYRKAAAAETLPCDIALEEVVIHLTIHEPDEAVKLLDAIAEPNACGPRIAELREQARVMPRTGSPQLSKPPNVP